MALERRQIGNRVFIVDTDNKLVFTIGEVKKANERYAKFVGRAVAREARQN